MMLEVPIFLYMYIVHVEKKKIYVTLEILIFFN